MSNEANNDKLCCLG